MEKHAEESTPTRVQRPPTNILACCTVRLCATYKACNPAFGYTAEVDKKLVLTKPSEGVSNGGRDNVNQELIIHANDELGPHHTNTYQVVDTLGCGTFGQVVKAVNTRTRDMVAVKVIKNHSAYFSQAKMEIFILKSLQDKYAGDTRFRIVRLYDYFMHFDHLCLVFEVLHVNLYELLRSNHYKGLSLTVIRVFLKQLLNALSILQEMHIIHCDLKPENILLSDQSTAAIKLIDFGSACLENQTVYTYIQSRYYRSPEVLCGYPYNSKIDMWSLGCILAELFLGLPLFPGGNEYNQMARIVEMCGCPPPLVLEGGKHASKYFRNVPSAPPPAPAAPEDEDEGDSESEEAPKGEAVPPPKKPFSLNSMLSLGSPTPKERGKKKGKETAEDREMGVEMTTIASAEHLDMFYEGPAEKKKPASTGSSPTRGPPRAAEGAAGTGVMGEWRLKSEEEFCRDSGAPAVPWKRYFNYTQLEDLILHVPYKAEAGNQAQARLDRIMFADFLRGLLLPDFRERWTAEQALEHPFVSEDGRHGFAGPGRYHTDVVLVENARVEQARQAAERRRAMAPPPPPHVRGPPGTTRSVPIPRQQGLQLPYPASWGSLIGTSPGYSSSPTNAASANSLLQPFGPPSPYTSGLHMHAHPDPSQDDFCERSTEQALSDNFSFAGSYDPSAGSGLARHLAYAQLSGNWPPPAPPDQGPPPPPPLGPPPPGHQGPGISNSIPVPRPSEGLPISQFGLSFEQHPGPPFFPPSPMVQSPGSFYGAHMHPGAAAQLLGMSPTVSNSSWDPYSLHAPKPPGPPGNTQQQRRPPVPYNLAAQRERALSWSAPKPSSLGLALGLGSAPTATAALSGNPRHAFHGAGPQRTQTGDSGRPHGHPRHRRKGHHGPKAAGPDVPPAGPRPPPQTDDALWDPFFNEDL